MNNETKVVS